MKPAIHPGFLVLAAFSLGAAACTSATGGATGSSTSATSSGATSTGGTTGGATTGGTTTGGTTTGGTTTGGTAGGGTFSLSFPALTLHTGDEITECVVVNLGNSATLHLGEIHNSLSAGGFNFVIYRSSDTQPQPTPFACGSWSHFGQGADAPLILSHKADDDLVLPSGVGLTLQPNQMLRLELHAINRTAIDLQVSASSVLTAMPVAQFQTEAAFLFLGDSDVNLPPNSMQTTQGFLAVPPRVVPADAKFVQIDGHTHQLGTKVSISTATASAETPVYSPTNWDWSDSPRLDTAPPFSLAPDGGFKIACNYNNTSPQTVQFGRAAGDEICFLGAYVYPSNGAFVCIHTDSVSGGFDLCCPGGGTTCDNLFP